MQNLLRTWQKHQLINNLAQLPTQSKFKFPCTILLQNHCVFFCTLHLNPTNIEVRYSIQATASLFLQARVFISPCLFSTRSIKTQYQQMFLPYTCQYRSRHMYAVGVYFCSWMLRNIHEHRRQSDGARSLIHSLTHSLT